MKITILCILASLAFVNSEIYFQEDFTSENVLDKWISSTHKGGDQGTFEVSAGKAPADDKAKGLRTTQDAKFYGISTKLDKPFSNKDKPLVIQFTVKHEQNIDCGGGYVKILGSEFDQKDFHGETPYKIMFGPDICGVSTKKVHVIFNYKDKNHLIKDEIRCKDDALTHLYTLIVKPDNTYEVLIDNESAKKGSLEEDWDMIPPKEVPDESVTKPTDWIDDSEMDDPEDKKPEDWDKPKSIPDPNAKKPDDWDDEMDGEWEAPVIDNPDYKGEWFPKKIPNPAYKGEWKQPLKANPDYKPDPEVYKFDDIGGLGFDLWQVKSGTIFSKILITDDVATAKKHGEEHWKTLYDAETKLEEENKKKEAEKEKEEASKAEKEKEDSGKEEKDDENKKDEPEDSEKKSDHDEL